jgi:hypothetical protein
MPMYDWIRFDAGIYHDFHNRWITHLTEVLNAGLLPDTHYAFGEAGNVSSTLKDLNKSGEEGKIDNFRQFGAMIRKESMGYSAKNSANRILSSLRVDL